MSAATLPNAPSMNAPSEKDPFNNNCYGTLVDRDYKTVSLPVLDVLDFNERIIRGYEAGTAEKEMPADLSLSRSLVPAGTATDRRIARADDDEVAKQPALRDRTSREDCGLEAIVPAHGFRRSRRAHEFGDGRGNEQRAGVHVDQPILAVEGIDDDAPGGAGDTGLSGCGEDVGAKAIQRAGIGTGSSGGAAQRCDCAPGT